MTSCTSGHLDAFALGGDGGLWHDGYNGTTWSGWQAQGGQWTSSPSAVCRVGTTTIDVFERGNDRAVWHTNVAAS